MNAQPRNFPPDVFTDGPGKLAPVMIWDDGAPRQVELRWGLRPFEPGGRSFSLLRAEDRIIGNRCVLPLTEFYLRPGSAPGNKRRRVEWAGTQRIFCAAGTWQPATDDWPASFAALTIEAYPDIAPFQDRHMAIVRQEDWKDWLEGGVAAERILRPLPSGSLRVSGPPVRSRDLFAR